MFLFPFSACVICIPCKPFNPVRRSSVHKMNTPAVSNQGRAATLRPLVAKRTDLASGSHTNHSSEPRASALRATTAFAYIYIYIILLAKPGNGRTRNLVSHLVWLYSYSGVIRSHCESWTFLGETISTQTSPSNVRDDVPETAFFLLAVTECSGRCLQRACNQRDTHSLSVEQNLERKNHPTNQRSPVPERWRNTWPCFKAETCFESDFEPHQKCPTSPELACAPASFLSRCPDGTRGRKPGSQTSPHLPRFARRLLKAAGRNEVRLRRER